MDDIPADVVEEVLRAAAVERTYENAVHGKDFNDEIWAHYIDAMRDRRQAVDALFKAGYGRVPAAAAPEGLGL